MKEKGFRCEKCHHGLCTSRVPIFFSLNADEHRRISDLVVHKHYEKNELIFMEGDSLGSLIIIHYGKVKAYRYTPDGKEQILYIFTDGDFLGEKNILRKQMATYNAEALEDTEVCVIRREPFQRMLLEYPEISLKIAEELCERLEKLETMVQSLGTKDVESRVSMLLLEFAKKFGREHPKGKLIELPLSREGIANYIGVTRETVSRKFSLLQKDGIIELIGNRKVILLDETALERSI